MHLQWQFLSLATAVSSLALPDAHGPIARDASSTKRSSCSLPSTPLTNAQQVGDSILGTLCQPHFPPWLPDGDGKPYPEAPWGERTVENSEATIEGDVPVTKATRSYNFTITRAQLSPDGVLRDMILINGQFPGPVIEANWGDIIEVSVYNGIVAPEEGTSIHWHGMLQRQSQWEDGTPGVSQCPIAPGQSYTYSFIAEVYGTSLYHAHYSAQFTAGLTGAMVIHGPASAEYDIDLGPVMLGDWNHIPYFSMVSDVVGTDFSKFPPLSDNGLINGRGQFDCSQPSFDNSSDWLGSNLKSNLTWTCVDGAERAKFAFKSGKTHRLRLMNTGADGIQKFSIDGHTMTVIATDYVPVEPYATDVVTLGVGQRTDILVKADLNSTSAVWMRTQLPGGFLCGGLGTANTTDGTYPQVLAGIYYEDADTTLDPTSTSTINDTSCYNQALDLTHPSYPIPAPSNPYIQDVYLTLDLNSTGSFEWRINNQTYRADFNTPILYSAAKGATSFPDNPEWNVYDFGNNASIVLNVTNATPFDHPFHLHGHTFFVLNSGGPTTTPALIPSSNGPPAGILDGSTNTTLWDGTTVDPANPTRRDVQIVPAGGYAALQFEADNPGVWPFHCHVAWHLSGGLSMNVLTRADEIVGLPKGQKQETCVAWKAWTSGVVVDQIDSGS